MRALVKPDQEVAPLAARQRAALGFGQPPAMGGLPMLPCSTIRDAAVFEEDAQRRPSPPPAEPNTL